MDWILQNWAALLLGFMAFLKVIVNLTPSEKDNKIFAWLDLIVGWIVPNLKKNGGRHK